MYGFMAKELGLDLQKIQDTSGNIIETGITIEPFPAYMFLVKKAKSYLPMPSKILK
jgi:hypothetical protein